LFIGIDTYHNHVNLLGAAQDARALSNELKEDDTDDPQPRWPVTNDTLLVASGHEEITERDLRLAANGLLDGAEGDDILFYFAGHGFNTPDDGLVLASSDDDEGDVRRGLRIRSLLDNINASGASSATVILDCCHAGLAAGPNIGKNVVIIAGAEASARASEMGRRGKFTRLLIEGLKGGAADIQGRITAVSLYNYVSGALSRQSDGQVPVLKARLEDLVVLRQVRAKLGLLQLRRLAQTFSESSQCLVLTPDFEASEEQTKRSQPPLRSRPDPMDEPLTNEQDQMDYFKILRDAGLLDVIDPLQKTAKPDLFWACMHGGKVSLTPLGQYYWELAISGHLR